MPLAKCLRCDKLFDKSQSSVCPGCQPDEEADHELIRDTLDNNPDLNAEQVSELSGVNIKCVMRMIDDGHIVNISMGEAAICGRCGKPAISQTKKLCEACLEKLNQEVAQQRKNIRLGEKKKAEVGEYSGKNVRSMMEDKKR